MAAVEAAADPALMRAVALVLELAVAVVMVMPAVVAAALGLPTPELLWK